MNDALSALVHVNFVRIDARDRVDREKEVPLPDADETTGTKLQHADLPLAFVDEETGYVTNVRAMPIDDFAAPYVLSRL
jgi:hypothetical protein